MKMPRVRGPLLPWAVWGTAALAYAFAVINRSSLAALGPVAQEHFGIDATALSSFAVIQLVVYAVLQIPVGVLLDRFGATSMILVGGIMMIVGQVVMSIVSEVGFAILSRMLIGAGDACTFISVMRLLPEWFSLRQIPIVSQLTGLIGQAGQLVSVAPLALIIGEVGWRGGFLGVTAVGVLVTILGAVVLRNAPGSGTALERLFRRAGPITERAEPIPEERPAPSAVAAPPTEMLPVFRRRRGLGLLIRARRLLSLPGVRLAYWVHFTAQFSINAFVLLWGVPFLIGGVGLSQASAGGFLSLTIVASMAANVLLGPVTSRFMEHRISLVVIVTIAIASLWILTLCWPGVPPRWLLVALMIVMPLGGPAALIAFDVARSHTPKSLIGFSTGLVNTGGFTASLIVILLIGIVLDLLGAGTPETYSLTTFKSAFAVQVPCWGLGLTMILVERGRTRRWMKRHGRRLR